MRWGALLLALGAGGCQYAEERGRDFLDMFRLEGHLGPGLQADIKATELLHFGFGSSQGARTGFNYGALETDRVLEHHLPASIVTSITHPDQQALHLISWGLEAPQHRCYVMLPGVLNNNTMQVDALHFFDIELGLYAIFPGARIGFSPGEFLDFFLGLWTFDLAGDDSFEGRSNKRLMKPHDPAERPFTDDAP
jgi:hypothetical protein